MNMTKGQGLADLKRFLAFSLANEEYAVPLLSVKEVIAVPDVTPVPYSPPHFLGIMNLRGQVISVLDLRLKFQMKNDRGAETVVIICDLGSICIGVVVNSVNSVLALSEEDILPKPELQNAKQGDHIMGVTRKGDHLVLLIDIARALDVKDVSTAQQHQAKAAS